jgi:hypothetical protein
VRTVAGRPAQHDRDLRELTSPLVAVAHSPTPVPYIPQDPDRDLLAHIMRGVEVAHRNRRRPQGLTGRTQRKRALGLALSRATPRN